jgi:hypothetical protein
MGTPSEAAEEANIHQGSYPSGYEGRKIMKRWYIFKDGMMIGFAPTKEEAIEKIRVRQKRETHYMIRSEFSIIKGEQEFVKYER